MPIRYHFLPSQPAQINHATEDLITPDVNAIGWRRIISPLLSIISEARGDISPSPSQISSGMTTRTPRARIFYQDVTPPVSKFDLPETGGRFTSTSQLAYCISISHPSLSPTQQLDKAGYDWSQSIEQDEQERLWTIVTDIIGAFVRDDLKMSYTVAEVVGLAAILGPDESGELLKVFVNDIKESQPPKTHMLDGLANLIKNAPLGNFDADDICETAVLIGMCLSTISQLSTQSIHHIMPSALRVLDSMVDSQIMGIRLEWDQQYILLNGYLAGLHRSSDPYLVYQAAYAYQALRYIPNEGSILYAMAPRIGKVVQGTSGVVSAARSLDVSGFIGELQNIQGQLAPSEVMVDAHSEGMVDAHGDALMADDRPFLDLLRKDRDLHRKSTWYPALRGLDMLIQEGRFTAFEKLIREAPCRQDASFQWGVCQRLEELAANTLWDSNIHQGSVILLGEIYHDDVTWNKHTDVRQWIVRILDKLARSEDDVAGHAQDILQDLETYLPFTAGIQSNPVLCTTTSPSPLESRLLDSAQNMRGIETSLLQLKQGRLKGHTQGVYIQPRATLNARVAEDFDLTTKVQEFINGNKKVFLLLGDAGVGKSTFIGALEINLWIQYRKASEPIPLHIYLPTIDSPERDMIAKQLRRANFSENQIRDLKLYREFILLCDGYDEIQQTRNLYISNQLNQPGGWRAQMIISCRTQHSGVNYKNRFQPFVRNHSGVSDLFQEAVIAPFNKFQVQEYIDQHVSLFKPPWGTKDYQYALDHIPNIQDLVTNPFLLMEAMDVLPRLVDLNDHIASHRVTLYDRFVDLWLDRSKQRLGELQLSAEDAKAYGQLHQSGFMQFGITYLKDLATAIYDNQDGNPVVNYSENLDQKTWKEALFNGRSETKLLREAVPLIRRDDQYMFIHKSVLEYGLSLAIFDPRAGEKNTESTSTSNRQGDGGFDIRGLTDKPITVIEQPLLDSPFGRRRLVDEPSVLQFLVGRAQQQPVFKQQLHAVIERSKTDRSVRVAAANAITVLVKAGVSFIGANLKGIRIPGADLSHGKFDSAQLDGADLREADLRNIWIREANLSGAQMSGTQLGELPHLQENSMVICCEYSPNGGTYAVGLWSGDISLYETTSWNRLRTLGGHKNWVRSLAFSYTSDRIASASEDGTLRLWDVHTGRCIYSFRGHSDVITGVVYSSTGNQIASGSWDKTVRLWDVETGNCIHTLRGHGDIVTNIIFSPKGDRVASGSEDHTVRLWDVGRGDCIYTFRGHYDVVTGVVYSPKGDQIASGSEDSTVRIWDIETGNCVHTLRGHDDVVTRVVYSPKGDQIASGSWDSAIRVWDVDRGNVIQSLLGHGDAISSITYSPKGTQIASGSWDGTVRLWDAETGGVIRVLLGHGDTITSIVYSPTGNQIASGSWDKTVRLWSVHQSWQTDEPFLPLFRPNSGVSQVLPSSSSPGTAEVATRPLAHHPSSVGIEIKDRTKRYEDAPAISKLFSRPWITDMGNYVLPLKITRHFVALKDRMLNVARHQNPQSSTDEIAFAKELPSHHPHPLNVETSQSEVGLNDSNAGTPDSSPMKPPSLTLDDLSGCSRSNDSRQSSIPQYGDSFRTGYAKGRADFQSQELQPIVHRPHQSDNSGSIESTTHAEQEENGPITNISLPHIDPIVPNSGPDLISDYDYDFHSISSTTSISLPIQNNAQQAKSSPRTNDAKKQLAFTLLEPEPDMNHQHQSEKRIKRRRIQLSVEDKVAVIEFMENNPSKSVRDVARVFSLPRTTIYGIFKMADTLKLEWASKGDSFRVKKSQYWILEALLTVWIKDLRIRGIPVPGKKITTQAFEIYRMLSCLSTQPLPPCLFSSGWLKGYKKRYGITHETMRDDATHTEEQSSLMQQLHLKSLVDRFAMDDIYTCEVSSMFLTENPEFGFNFHRQSGNATHPASASILLCCNASGSDMRVPHVDFRWSLYGSDYSGGSSSSFQNARSLDISAFDGWLSDFDSSLDHDIVLLVDHGTSDLIDIDIDNRFSRFNLKHIQIISVQQQLCIKLPIKLGLAIEFKLRYNRTFLELQQWHMSSPSGVEDSNTSQDYLNLIKRSWKEIPNNSVRFSFGEFFSSINPTPDAHNTQINGIKATGHENEMTRELAKFGMPESVIDYYLSQDADTGPSNLMYMIIRQMAQSGELKGIIGYLEPRYVNQRNVSISHETAVNRGQARNDVFRIRIERAHSFNISPRDTQIPSTV